MTREPNGNTTDAARVFVVQLQKIRDRETGEVRYKYDVPGSNAVDYGEIVPVISGNFSSFDAEDAISHIWSVMTGRNFNPDIDHIVLIGNPCFIAWTVAVAARIASKDGCGATIRLLEWSGREQKYLPVVATIY